MSITEAEPGRPMCLRFNLDDERAAGRIRSIICSISADCGGLGLSGTRRIRASELLHDVLEADTEAERFAKALDLVAVLRRGNAAARRAAAAIADDLQRRLPGFEEAPVLDTGLPGRG